MTGRELSAAASRYTNRRISRQKSVHVAWVYPTVDFPTETREVLGLRSCLPTRIAVELVIKLMRCVPVSDDQTGCPPVCKNEAAARVIQTDSATVLDALLCCVPSIGSRRNGPLYVIGQQRTLEPRGGIEQRVTVALSSCPCNEES